MRRGKRCDVMGNDWPDRRRREIDQELSVEISRVVGGVGTWLVLLGMAGMATWVGAQRGVLPAWLTIAFGVLVVGMTVFILVLGVTAQVALRREAKRLHAHVDEYEERWGR